MRNAIAILTLLIIAAAFSRAARAEYPAAPSFTVRFADVAAECAPDIHIKTLAAVVRHESAVNPYAININGAKPLETQPTNAADAALVARHLLNQGYNIDVGLAQINSNNLKWLQVSLEDLFTPCPNLHAAARVLSACYRRGVAALGEGQAALHAALSCYNTGSLRNGIANGYVRKVAAQVALPVPELLPLADGPVVPVPPAAAHADTTANPATFAPGVPDSEPDAFSASPDSDVFGEKAGTKPSGERHQN